MHIQKFCFHDNTWNFSEDFVSEAVQLVLVFGSSTLIKRDDICQEILRKYKDAACVFCSTAGEIYGTEVYDDSVSGLAFSFEKTKVLAVEQEIFDSEQSFEVGKSLAQNLPQAELAHLFVFSDGLKVNGSDLVQGIRSVHDSVSLSGGLAGDGTAFGETFVSLSETPGSSKKVVLVGLYGSSLQVGTGAIGGWDVFGPKRKITKSHENTVYELDGKPVLDLYDLYLGDLAKDLPSSGLLFPLSISKAQGEEELVRTMLSINKEEKSVTFAGDVPEGYYAQLMKANFERLVEGASQAAQKSVSKMEHPQVALLISCIGRKLVLKQRIEEELEAVQEFTGKECILSGFYSYGEIGPSGDDIKNCQLHNQTMTITVLKEIL